jgi:hypothetical protein
MCIIAKNSLRVLLLASFIVAGCRETSLKEPKKLFAGQCEIEIESPVRDAKILLDGIVLGQGAVRTSVACGVKEVRVIKKGYVPYVNFLKLKAGEAIKIEAQLELPKSTAPEAFDRVLLSKAVISTSAKLAVLRASAAGASVAPVAPSDSDTPRDQWDRVDSWR